MPDFSRLIDEFLYSLIVMFAGIHWSLQKAVFMAGYTVKLINQWLIDSAFAPLIAQTNDSLRLALSLVFVLALLILGFTYLLAAFVRLDVVSPRSALLWYLAGLLFFTIGPSFYQSMNDFRLALAQGMYLSVLNGLADHSGDFSSLARVNAADLPLGYLCDQFDVYLPTADRPGPIDGLDIAMAYLRAHAVDVMGYDQPTFASGCGPSLQNPNPATWAAIPGSSVVPMSWNFTGAYFDHTTAPVMWDDLTPPQRTAAVAWAGASQQRALTAWPLLLFALVEQVVHLLITIAMGITFVSFAIAILFAFFKRTESIAHHLINQWIELLVQTIIIALIQALVIGFFLAGTATGSPPALVGLGLLCLVFILITLASAVKAVWNAFNRLFNAMGQVTGGVMVAPGTAALATAGTGAAAAGAAVTVGSNALAGLTALQRGATLAQAAGVALGGSPTLSGAARTLTYLPGTRNTAVGEAAQQFTEGSATRQVARNLPLVGRVAGPLLATALLSDRDPAHAASPTLLVPAVADRLEAWTNPRRVGAFTPTEPPNDPDARRQRERSDHHADMRSEELEQHLSDLLRPTAPTDRLDGAAAALLQAAHSLTGHLRVAGVPNVAAVMGDVVGQVQSERGQTGQPPNTGVDHLQVAHHMARAVGVTPQETGGSPIQRDLTRFGLFVDQALRLGLSPQQTEQVVREVQASPEGKLSPATRDLLDRQVQTTQNVSWLRARDDVDRLEHSARMLPPEITAYGAMRVPLDSSPPQVNVTVDPTVQVNVQTPAEDPYHSTMRRESAMGGSGSVIRGGS